MEEAAEAEETAVEVAVEQQQLSKPAAQTEGERAACGTKGAGPPDERAQVLNLG